MMFIYTIHQRGDIENNLRKFVGHYTRFGENNIRKIVTQDLSEFRTCTLMNYLDKRNIRHEFAGPENKDEFVDYYVRSIQVMLKLMMTDADGIDESLWSEGIFDLLFSPFVLHDYSNRFRLQYVLANDVHVELFTTSNLSETLV